MNLRSSQSHPTAVPPPIADLLDARTMATDLTNYSTARSKAIPIELPTLSNVVHFMTTFCPALKLACDTISHDDRYRRLLFIPPGTSAANIAVNKANCTPDHPGVYPIHTAGTDAATYRLTEERYKRDCSKYTDANIAQSQLKAAIIKSMPEWLRATIFPADIDFAVNNSLTQIFTAVKSHFSAPSILDLAQLEDTLDLPFVYTDATSYEQYTANFRSTVATLALLDSPLPMTRQTAKFIANLQASPDADIFALPIQVWSTTHYTTATVNLQSLTTALACCIPQLAAKIRSAPATTYSYGANGVKKANVPGPAKHPQTYCYSHGWNSSHTSATCPRKRPDHNDACTWENRKDYPGYAFPRRPKP